MRTDVQGLRAVAVLLVVVTHLGVDRVPGGYVGVDVFFVISGFLITGLLLRARERPDAPGLGAALVDFYSRRARRILPAATVVLVATCAASAVLLPVVRVSEILTDAWWSALFAANVRFAMVETDYFAEGRPVSPLQHYWSLAVEEQFYLVWPVLLLLVAALMVRRRRDPVAGIQHVLTVLVLASLAWSAWATYASPDTAYFSTFTRGWQLGAGGLLAVVLHRRTTSAAVVGEARARRRAAGLLAGVGVVLVVAAALVLTPASPVPGVVAAVPVLGAVLLLLAGALPGGDGTLVARGLSVRPMQVVGDWSYSIYLWHFPVIVVARSYLGGLSPLAALVCVLVIGVLSGLTYHLVEQPFRRRGSRWDRPRWALPMYPAAVGTLAVAVLASQLWLDQRLASTQDNPAIEVADYADAGLSRDPVRALVQASVLAAEEGRPVPGDLVPGLVDIRRDTASLGDCDYRTGTRQLCPDGDADSERLVVLAGDSHARAWSPAVRLLGERLGYRVLTLAYTGCPTNLAIRIDPETGRPWQECADFVDFTLDTVAELQPELVLVSNAPLAPVVDVDSGEVVERREGPEVFGDALDRGLGAALERLAADADRVVLLANTPKLPREQAVCLSRASDLGECLLSPERPPRRLQRGFIEVAEEVGVESVDAEKWFCEELRCPSVVGRFVTMRDSEHMTTAYSEHLAGVLADALRITRL
jgi:peptidoglycan/LPS O-acetylase OafA/YrhL